MQTSHNPIQAQMRHVLDELGKLRDEIRVHIDLGGMEAKKAWDELEPKLADADCLAENASEEAFRDAVDTLRKVKLFRSTLPRDPKNRA